MRNDFARFQTAGCDVAVVTMGSPAQMADFRQRLQLPFPCFSDTSQVAYRAFGVPRGTTRQVAGVAIWWQGLKALFRGGMGVPRGDVKQLHAAFAIAAGGEIRWVHAPKNSADYPDNRKLLAALNGPSS